MVAADYRDFVAVDSLKEILCGIQVVTGLIEAVDFPGKSGARKMGISFPGESAEYRIARDQLLQDEIALRRTMEALAVARRALPPGGLVSEDYVFDDVNADGEPVKVKLSELFAPSKDSLVIYHFMFPRMPQDERPGPTEGLTARLKLEEGPCPSCTTTLDELDRAAKPLSQKVNFAVIAKAPLDRVITFAKERGWQNLHLLSSAGNNFKRDYHAESPEGVQMPMMTVFHRSGDEIRHFWSSELLYSPSDPGQDPRHLGTLDTIWNVFDFTPGGRPSDWDEQLSYDCCHSNHAPVS